MLIEPYTIRPLNLHYEGAYSTTAMEWRRAAARDKVQNLAQILAGRRPSSVLEVGCGTGAVLGEVARRGIGNRHIGVDIADPWRHLDPDARGLDFKTYDGLRLPFDDDSFDLVYATHVLEHVPDPRGFLTELARVCSGLIYVEVPCEMHIRVRRTAVQSALDTGHINAYSPEYFLVLLQTSGLDILDLQLFDHSLEVHSFGTSHVKGRMRMAVRRAMLRVSPVLASRLFCYHCGALARKGVAASVRSGHQHTRD
jgi:SAM-dependent methyltransferase